MAQQKPTASSAAQREENNAQGFTFASSFPGDDRRIHAVLAMPHVRAHAGRRQAVDRLLGPLGSRRQQRIEDRCARSGAPKEKVEVSIDYITSQGNKNLLTIAAEAQARSGHDILAFPTWEPQAHRQNLEPVDDVMTELIKQNGTGQSRPSNISAAPTAAGSRCRRRVGSQIKGPCSRIDLLKKHAGIDVAGHVSGRQPAEGGCLDARCHAQGRRGVPQGRASRSASGWARTEDNVDTAGAIFQSFGAALVDAKGNITVKSDTVRQALEYYKKLAQFLPPDAPAWDNASNNKYLISGKGSLIMNPPSAWAVAKRDAPQVAEQLWTHGMPAGPKGRYAPFLPVLLGHLEVRQEQVRRQEPARCISRRASAVEKMVEASAGYDLPAFEKLTDFKIWAEEGPPKGTLYHYPNPHNHQILSVAAAPAPPKIAHQIYTQAIHDQDGGALSCRARRMDKDARLGRKRARRLHAHLSSRCARRSAATA